MTFHDEEIAALFQACRAYQRANGNEQTHKAQSDQAFLDQICQFHEQQDRQDLADALPDTSTYNRHKNGSKPTKNVDQYLTSLAKFLEDVGYWPYDATFEQAADSICWFFGANPDSRSSKMLPELVGQYRCYQRSSWHKNHVMISTVSFTASGAETPTYLLVNEQQATGADVADAKGIIETVENFTGIAFSRQNMVYFTLREERLHTPKFCLIYQILPDPEERPASFLQGYTLKGSNGPNARLHISRMLLERLEDDIAHKTEMSGEPVDELPSENRLMSADRFAELHPRFHKRLFEIPLTEY